jgi:hypothetical protein
MYEYYTAKSTRKKLEKSKGNKNAKGECSEIAFTFTTEKREEIQ